MTMKGWASKQIPQGSHIGETGRPQGDRFREHLHNVEKDD